MAELNFDATTIATDEYSAIPAGEYQAVITDSVFKATKNNRGEYLELTFEIIDGEYRGRKIWSRLNLNNPNAIAVEIAQKELARICQAINVMKPKNSEELHNIPMTLVLTCTKNKDDEIINEIKKYKSASAAKPAERPRWQR